jgi:hypothetical protein
VEARVRHLKAKDLAGERPHLSPNVSMSGGSTVTESPDLRSRKTHLRGTSCSTTGEWVAMIAPRALVPGRIPKPSMTCPLISRTDKTGQRVMFLRTS